MPRNPLPRPPLLALIGLVALASTSCASGMMPMTRPLSDDGIFFVESGDPTHPRIRYLDGQVSQNSSCAIRLDNKLNRKIPPVYINGQPIGFC